MNRTMLRAAEATGSWLICLRLIADSHSVMTMRIMGIGGTWVLPRDEASEMLAEKVPAFTEAAVAGALTALSGKHPAQVMRATLEPLSVKAQSNRERLARLGPRVMGRPARISDAA